MRVLVTCGPSYEPLDQVRRLTNLSTGSLGVSLAERLATARHDVLCLKGTMATHPDPGGPTTVELFTTNDDLDARLRRLALGENYDAVFHVAALCDFRISSIEDPAGGRRTEGKIASFGSGLKVHLEPTRKLIGDFRALFPKAWIVGWKYEVDGPPQAALARGWQQITANRTDACVVNGPACADQFLVCQPPNTVTPCGDRETLVEFLAGMLSEPG